MEYQSNKTKQHRYTPVFSTNEKAQLTKLQLDYNTLELFLRAVGLECRVDQPCPVEIQHGMAVQRELKTKMFT